MTKIQISYDLEIDADALRTKYQADLKYGDTISEISSVLLQQLDLVMAGKFDEAYDLIKNWGAHQCSFMDPVTADIMNMIKSNRDRTNYGAKRNIKISE